jgi:hypothetical protein
MIITRDGRIVVSAHLFQRDCVTGQPSPGKGQSCVYISDDGGKSFHFSGGDTRGNNDVDLAESGGVLLQSSMTSVAIAYGASGVGVARSTDRGKTWTEALAVNHQLVNDRPWLLATPDGAVVLTYDSIPGGIVLVRSTDNGATWGLQQPVALQASVIGAGNGAPAIDSKSKKLLVPFVGGSSPTCNCLDTFSVARGNYDGTGFTIEPVLQTEGGTGGTSPPAAAADAAGTEYIAVGLASGATSTSAHVRLLTRRAADATWTGQRLDPPGGSAMLPNIVAGPAGRVAVAYYWSPYPDAQSQDRPWYAVVADSRDSGRTFTRTTLSRIVWTGSAANHKGVLWDLFGLALDTRGRLHVAWTQMANSHASGSPNEIAYSQQLAANSTADGRTTPPSAGGPPVQSPAASPTSLPSTGAPWWLGAMAAALLLAATLIRRQQKPPAS